MSARRFEAVAEQAAEQVRLATERFEAVAREAAEHLRQVAAAWEEEMAGRDTDGRGPKP